jgi:hypothetical protein
MARSNEPVHRVAAKHQQDARQVPSPEGCVFRHSVLVFVRLMDCCAPPRVLHLSDCRDIIG